MNTRRYHGLLVAAAKPPVGRAVLLSKLEETLVVGGERFELSVNRYPGAVHPEGYRAILGFRLDPWPTWTLRAGGAVIERSLFMPHGRQMTVVTWRLVENGASSRARLFVKPMLSGRDYHALHQENDVLSRDVESGEGLVTLRPYRDVPAVYLHHNGLFVAKPDWYRNFRYVAETERGLDDAEDLLSPGWLTWDLTAAGEAVWYLRAIPDAAAAPIGDIVPHVAALRERERTRRAAFASPLHRAADAYLVRRGNGKTIVAGYPWFTDWGRDTFIALRGVCFATGRFDEGRDILLEWSRVVSEGMLPNRFPDGTDQPEFNAVDASLWFIIAVRDLLAAATIAPDQRATLMTAVTRILDGYATGTRYGIRMDADGLLACGVAGIQLTWMDARVGDRVITPRIGKPVEVQALWLNALAFAADATNDRRWLGVYERGRRAFAERFWNTEGGYLFDVVDVDHQAGVVDASFRPNQIFAIGLIDGERARRVVDLVEQRLLTPLGLRSLAPGDPAYTAHYGGGPDQRDAGYHQGTVWPWLMGAFVEGWLAVRGHTAEAKREARERFVAPLLAHLDEAGLGHVSEIADAEPPFTPRGGPVQAWSVGELLRVEAMTRAGAQATSQNTLIAPRAVVSSSIS
jgi:predicted glycogen debranching enzyme